MYGPSLNPPICLLVYQVVAGRVGAKDSSKDKQEEISQVTKVVEFNLQLGKEISLLKNEIM